MQEGLSLFLNQCTNITLATQGKFDERQEYHNVALEPRQIPLQDPVDQIHWQDAQPVQPAKHPHVDPSAEELSVEVSNVYDPSEARDGSLPFTRGFLVDSRSVKQERAI